MDFQQYVPLAPYTTFGIGGPARWFADATSEADILEAVRFAREANLPLFPLGGGSNLLVSDAGYSGLVLRISLPGIDHAPAPGTHRLFQVAAGENWDDLVSHTVNQNCAGIECLAGIPGTTGGTPVQNVGAYGQEVADTISTVRVFDLLTASSHEFRGPACGFAYRSSRFNREDRGRYIVTRVDFLLTEGGKPTLNYADIKRYFEEHALSQSLDNASRVVRSIRRSKGMVLDPGDPDSRSAGSFFKNPVVPLALYQRISDSFAPAPVPHYPAPDAAPGGQYVKLPAAWLLEKSGFHRGYTLGEAGISSRHTLALINRGSAHAADILRLSEAIIAGVKQQFGILLEPEPVWLG
jgi:UDP-N-acetylmuramate dehydrogenase